MALTDAGGGSRMSVMGGIPVPEGPARGSAGRRELPRPLNTVRVLLLVLFGATVLGALGLFGSALAVDALGAEVIGILLYAAAPGILGLLLARHVRTGGKRVWWGLVAVQVWLVLGGVANIGDGSAHGFPQLLLPVLILVFLTRQQSRAWFLLPPGERGERPKFSLPHMITWRRDRGQTALEYLGLVLIVVALIAAMALSGVGGRITAELQSAICSLSGYSCPASGDGTGRVEAGGGQGGGATGGEAAGGSTAGADGGTTVTGGTGSTGGTNGGTNGSSGGGDASDGGTAGGSSGGTSVSGGTGGPTTAVRAAGSTPTPRTARNPRPTTTYPRPTRTTTGTTRAAATGQGRRTAAAGASSAAPGTARPRSSRGSRSTGSGATSPGSSTCSSPRRGPASRTTASNSATSGCRTPRMPATSGATATTSVRSGTGARRRSTPS